MSAAPAAFVPASAIAGVAWPAVPAGDAAALFAILDQLGQSQWWPPAVLRRHQFRQLTALLDHAVRTVPFYRDRLAQAGWRPGCALDEATWRRIPWLKRRDIQDAGPALASSAVPPEHGAVDTVTTSGSTGMPIAVRHTTMSSLFWKAILLRDHLWHGRDLGLRLAMIRSDRERLAQPPHGLELPNWGAPTVPYYATGPAAMLDVTAPLAVQAEWLLRQRADYLLTHPTNLLFLARHCRAHGIALGFRGIATLAEPVGPEHRALCRAVFGAAITDFYSTRDAGYLALQCPSGAHYHVQGEDVLVEILDEAGNACAPGAMGRVVVTPLHGFAMPLIRYDIGDYAVPGPPCACGRGLPVIERILGRTRNMLRRPSGELLFPGFTLVHLAEIEPVIQVQVVQTALDRLEARLAVRRPLTDDENARAHALLAKALGGEFVIAISTCAEIPRSAGGKYEEFRSEIVDQ
jgi:phenylacetate-CoA ligase